MFLSKIYMPNIFVLTKEDDNYSYLFCHIADYKFIPLFYDIDDINKTFTATIIADMCTNNIKKISTDKAELFSYGHIKPVILTTLDRRGQGNIEYYGKKYLNHFLIA